MRNGEIAKFEERGDVLFVDLTEWSGDPEPARQDEERFLQLAEENEYRGTVTDVTGVTLSPDTQTHIEESWAQLIDATDIERFAYLSDGIEAMAVVANLEASAEVENFDDVGAAVDWAKG